MTCDPWPVVWPCDPLPEVSDEQMEAALAAARTLLWSRTGRRLGVCTAVERYRVPPSGSGCGVPYMSDDLVWHNGGRGGMCCAIHLASQPVQSVTRVTIGGLEVPSNGYQLNGSVLMRVGTCWPTVLDCDPPVIEVEYRWGVPLTPAVVADPEADPPVVAVEASPLWGMAAMAMGEVANELMQAMCGGTCRISSRAITVTQGGRTVQLADPGDTRDAGLLGTELADALITSVNPGARQVRSRVYSPDMATLS